MRYAILLPLAVLALASFAGCPPRQQAMPASVPPHAIVRGVPAPPPAAPKSTHPPVTKAMYDDIGAFDTPADLTKKIGWAPTKTPLPRVEYGYASRSSRKGEIVYIVFEHDVVVSCPAACVADAGVDVPTGTPLKTVEAKYGRHKSEAHYTRYTWNGGGGSSLVIDFAENSRRDAKFTPAGK